MNKVKKPKKIKAKKKASKKVEGSKSKPAWMRNH